MLANGERFLNGWGKLVMECGVVCDLCVINGRIFVNETGIKYCKGDSLDTKIIIPIIV